MTLEFDIDRLNIGCGKSPLDGYINLDRTKADGAEIAFDLETCNKQRLPFPDNRFSVIEASHVLEHITNLLPLMEELHRVAKPDAIINIAVPHGMTAVAFEDPTHIRQFFTGSFWYFGQPAYARADYGYRGDWITTKVEVLVEEIMFNHLAAIGVNIEFALQHMFGVALEINAQLKAVKPIRKVMTKVTAVPLTIRTIRSLPEEAYADL